MSAHGLFADTAVSSGAGEIQGAAATAQTGAYAKALREIWRTATVPPESRQLAVREVARYATLAPSHCNTQPWRIRTGDSELLVHPDFTRRMPVADPDDEQLFVALGCAAENASVAARAFGLNGEVAYHPMGRGGLRVELRPLAHVAPSELFYAIPRRQSTRGIYDGRVPSIGELRLLERCAQQLDVHVGLVTERFRMDRIIELQRAAQSIQAADADHLRELKCWTRFNERDALRQRDGLFTRCAGKPSMPRWLGAQLLDMGIGRLTDGGENLKEIRSSGGFAVFFGAGHDPRHWTAVGRACERFLLQATALNIKVALVGEPIEVRATRVELAMAAGADRCLPSLLVRFGYAAPSVRALRRGLEQVMV